MKTSHTQFQVLILSTSSPIHRPTKTTTIIGGAHPLLRKESMAGDHALPPVNLAPQEAELEEEAEAEAEPIVSESDSESLDQSESVSDSESAVTDSSPPPPAKMPQPTSAFGDGRVRRLDDDDKVRRFVERLFLFGMGDLGRSVAVAAVHRCSHSSFAARARAQAFRLYSDAVAQNRGGVNIKCAWFGGPKDALRRILTHGFAQCERPAAGVLFGSGVYLSPATSSFSSSICSTVDEDGLRHLLLCRVIMGKSEEIPAGSNQFHPTSEDFDSGVDNLRSPNWFVVWPSHMNTHILPEFVVSFRTSPVPEEGRRRVMRPTSKWMSFPKLISLLGGVLAPPAMDVIKKHHAEYMNGRMSRECLVRRVRAIAGDRMLVAAIRAFCNRARGNINNP